RPGRPERAGPENGHPGRHFRPARLTSGGGLHGQVQGRAGRGRALRRRIPGGRADRLLLRRGRRAHRAQRPHPRPSTEHRLAPLLEPLRRSGGRLASTRAARRRAGRRHRLVGVSGVLLAVRNVLKAWALLVVGCAALAGLGWVLGGYRLLSIFVFCGALLAAALYWTSDRVALGLVGARELPLAEAPGFHSTVERLAAVAGILKPRLYVIPDGLPRALAAGRGPRGSALAVSSGLLSAATPAELEAVIAHELAHVRHRDVVVQTSVVVLAATLLESSRIGGWFQRALLFVLG